MIRQTLCLAIACQAFITSGTVSGETTPQPNLKHAPASMQLSDALLNHAWTASRDAWNSFDTPHYQAVLGGPHTNFWPDPVPGIRAQYYTAPNAEYTKSILNAAGDREEASLHWPVILELYHRHVGDEAFVESLVRSALPRWLASIQERTVRNGSLIRCTTFWPTELTVGMSQETVRSSADPVTNAFFYRALQSAKRLQASFGLRNRKLETILQSIERDYREAFWDDDAGLFGDRSPIVNAVALSVGLMPEEGVAPAIQLIRKNGFDCDPLFVPYLIEASFIAGETRLGIDLLTFIESFETNPAALYLIPEYLLGLKPAESGWQMIEASPRLPDSITAATVRFPVPDGRVSLQYTAGQSFKLTIPIGARVVVDTIEGQNMVIKKYTSHTDAESLSEDAIAVLEGAGWAERVGDEAAIWISIDDQMLRVVQGNTVTYQARCASAEKGVGSMMNSLKTPLGWHEIDKKIGADAAWGQVFRSRQPTREIWQPGEDTKEDLVLTRVMLLNGLEKGINRGGNVDSMARHIYIHGTNDEARIGTPTSHGCIRMTNDDVIEFFNMVPQGTKVLITATESGASTD